jgi:uncharacterized protein (TIGR03435 family)
MQAAVRESTGTTDRRGPERPDWIRRDTFDIDARAGFDAPAAQIRLMVQSLLEDRFKLVAQTEQRDMRYLALVPAHTNGQPGPYLRRLDDGDCYGRSVGEVYREELPDRALPFARNRLAGACYELRDLAEGLSSLLRTLVIDRTGLGGKWVYDAPYRALPLPPPVSSRLGAALLVDAGSATEPGLPSFTEALEEYLGLKLESAKGPSTCSSSTPFSSRRKTEGQQGGGECRARLARTRLGNDDATLDMAITTTGRMAAPGARRRWHRCARGRQP